LDGWSLSFGGQPDFAISDGQLVWSDGRSLSVARSGRDPDALSVIFPQLARFEVNLERRAIVVSHSPAVSNNTIRHLLVDQVLPRVVAHDGSLVLHAAGIEVPGGAILLLGLAGRGKSTLAASFHANGRALLSDDAMVVGQDGATLQCRPLYRSLRLFPDSVAAVFNGPRGFTPVADYTSKQNIIDLEEPEATRPGYAIRSIYWLGEPRAGPIAVRRLAHGEACMALVEHSFSLDPSDPGRAEARLRQAAALAATVPMFEIGYPRDFAILPELREAILADNRGD
jgi:hypothetical protein